MAKQIKTIIDKSIFDKICQKYFQDNNVYIKTKNGDLEIKYFGYSSDGNAAFKIPYLKNMAKDNLIIARKVGETIHAHVRFVEKQEDDMFIFYIKQFQIINIERSEERKSLEGEGKKGKEIIFVTNVISDFIIQNILSLYIKKVDDIKDSLKLEIGEAFKNFKIFFCNEGSSDVRMKFFQSKRKIIYIPSINSKDDEKNKEFNYYINNIYARDFSLQNKKELISEISIPIMYKMKLPYGYIQINHTEPLNKTAFNLIKRVAVSIDMAIAKENIFPPANEKIIVSNITNDGFGIVFKDRKFIRYFKTNSYVYLEMLLPDSKRASIMAIVRNISILENKVIRVGFQIDEIDALSEVHYREFVENIKS